MSAVSTTNFSSWFGIFGSKKLAGSSLGGSLKQNKTLFSESSISSTKAQVPAACEAAAEVCAHITSHGATLASKPI